MLRRCCGTIIEGTLQISGEGEIHPEAVEDKTCYHEKNFSLGRVFKFSLPGDYQCSAARWG